MNRNDLRKILDDEELLSTFLSVAEESAIEKIQSVLDCIEPQEVLFFITLDRCKNILLKMQSDNLLNITQNYTDCVVINHNGQEYILEEMRNGCFFGGY